MSCRSLLKVVRFTVLTIPRSADRSPIEAETSRRAIAPRLTNRRAEFLLSHNRDVVTLNTLRMERREEILRLARQRGAHSLRVFGSVARNEADENSDLDLLVSWEPGRSLMDHAGLVQDLQDLLGMKVHVGTEKSLHWYVRERILREATPL
jgi:predicted nucleotidyltransferase